MDEYYCWDEANYECSDNGCFHVMWVGVGFVEVEGGGDNWGC